MIFSENAKTVLERRYLTRDVNNNVVETIEGLFTRVATAVAAADANYGGDPVSSAAKFYKLMTDGEFLPNSPTLMNAGKPLGQLSACFVLPIEDSMEGIFESVKQAALIHKSGGGTGFSFSRLRQSGSTVASTGGVASGPVSFMKVFNMATEAVKQGGTRRGANMGILRVDHPDILSFIDAKSDNAEITNFNISVGITEAFMEAAAADKNYNLIDPKTKEVVGELNAKEIFDKIVDGAWKNGEPGIIFLDRLNRDNVIPSQGEIEATNPCGEQPLLPYESCNLGSINLNVVIKKGFNGYEIDYDKLRRIVHSSVHFLDNVIEVNKYPLEKIEEVTKASRKIGLGVMGFADLLLRLGVAYNSEAGVLIGEEVMKFINDEGHKASAELAKVRGGFPLFGESIFRNGETLRNGTVTTIAPTGTISMIAGASSGVEPVFAYAYFRNVMDGTKLIEANPILKEKLEELGLYTEEIMEKVIAEGTIAHIEEIPQNVRDIFVCAHDVSPDYHCKMQAAFQRHTDNAVSKTVNFSSDATREEVKEVFVRAYQLDCKGVTIYRDKSRDGQVLNIGKDEEVSETVEDSGKLYFNDDNNIIPRPRPEITSGFTEKVKIGCGNLYITVNYDENGICEVFTSTGKAGGCPSQSEATARLVSVAMRSGVDPYEVVYQLKGIRCPSTIRQSGMNCTSCPDAMAKVITKVLDYTKNGKEDNALSFAVSQIDKKRTAVAINIEGTNSKAIKHCPECGAKVEHEGGCVVCRDCGFSKCG